MKVITIAGTVGKDAELRRTQDGDPVASFSLAVDDGYGENKSTMWFDCSVFGKRGQSLQPHITKGAKLTVIGELGKREHNGTTYLTVRASDVALQGGNSPARERAPEQKPVVRKQAESAITGGYEDDIPF